METIFIVMRCTHGGKSMSSFFRNLWKKKHLNQERQNELCSSHVDEYEKTEVEKYMSEFHTHANFINPKWIPFFWFWNVIRVERDHVVFQVSESHASSRKREMAYDSPSQAYNVRVFAWHSYFINKWVRSWSQYFLQLYPHLFWCHP